jgi:hypothetical protein
VLLARWIRRSSLTACALTALSGCGASSLLFPSGGGTATITWHSVKPDDQGTLTRPQPFVGTVAGLPVTGTAAAAVLKGQGGAVSLPSRLALARWTGTFEGHRFSLTVSAGTGSLAHIQTLTFDVDGTFGSQPAHFVVGPASTSTTAISFHGTVGPHHVTGKVRLGQANGPNNKATAIFTVTG